MNTKIVKFISYILIVSIVLSTATPVAMASAKPIDLDKNEPKDWAIAFKDGITDFGFFHRAVQTHIINKHPGIEKEKKIEYSDTHDHYGSADLVRVVGIPSTYLMYIWEVKPASWWHNIILRGVTIAQLKRYIDADETHNTYGSNYDPDIPEGNFPTETIKGILYTVTYQNAGNGLIFYRFDRASKQEQKQWQEQKQTQSQGQPHWNGVPLTLPADEPESEDERRQYPIPDVLPELPPITVIPKTSMESVSDAIKARLVADYLVGGALIGAGVAVTLIALSRFSSVRFEQLAAAMMAGTLMPSDFLNMLSMALTEEEYDELINEAIHAAIYNGIDSETLEILAKALGISVEELIENFTNASKTTSPIIIDLDGNGISTISLHHGVFFDHSGNGFKTATGWVGEYDGLLVRDINGNGVIDSGRELFGNNTLLKNGHEATNGFEALKDLDNNKDNVFNANDLAWNEVKVWIDANSNGISEEGELISIEEAGIVSISLVYQNINIVDAQGNSHRQISTVTMEDGSVVDAVDVWFARNATNSTATNNLPVSEEISVLPDARGFGTAYSLHQSMVRDTSGQLQNLVEQFAAETNDATRRQLASQILHAWTGKNTNLAAMEVLVGEKYTGGTGPNAMEIIDIGFNALSRAFYEHLMAKTHLKQLYSLMMNVGTEDELLYDLTLVAYSILSEINEDESQGERLLLNFVNNIYANTMLGFIDIDSFCCPSGIAKISMS